MDGKSELVGIGCVGGLVQSVAHWFPWPRLIGQELQPPYTYMVGMSIIIGSFTAWSRRRKTLSWIEATCGLVAITILSGLPVIGAYAIDQILGKYQEKKVWG